MSHDEFRSSWSRLMHWRAECHRRFGAVQEFPLRTPHEEIERLMAAGGLCLDVGAGATKPFRGTVEKAGGNHFTLDTDPGGDFDYTSFAQIPEDRLFDLAVANQVLEHMPVEEAFDAVRACFRHVRPGGHMIATVPNAAHPVRQRDCTHVTPWPANDLYSLLKSAGFEIVTMARYNKFPLTSDPLKRWIVETVCAEFRVDWCDSVLATGRKQ